MKLSRIDGTVIFDIDELDTHEKLLKYCLINKISMAWADFKDVNFYKADFEGADFWNADFEGADFWNADFKGADFTDADFRDADFKSVKGDGYLIKSMQVDTYPVTLIKNMLQIGCKRFTIDEWNKHKELVFTFCALNENKLK